MMAVPVWRNSNVKSWALAATVFVYAAASFSLPRGFALTAFGDVTQCLLLAGCAAAAFATTRRAEGRTQLFWTLLSVGFGSWLIAQAAWTYYEVFARQEVPNPFSADVVLFLHIVPMMAALAVRPHLSQHDQGSRFSSLDFVLLLIWWLYLYAFVVIAWQFEYVNVETYGKSFDALYSLEHLVFLVCLLLVRNSCTGIWRNVYSELFWISLVYAVSSITAGAAIDAGQYYTGSMYDLPLVTAEAWFLGFVLRWKDGIAGEHSPGVQASEAGIWPARIAMLAVFSTPLMILWAAFGGAAPWQVRSYRLVLTAATMLGMGALVFFKQQLLDRELMALLHTSRDNLEQMRRLKEDIENKEQQLRWNSVELQRKNLELQQASLTDALTGMWNRRYLEEVLGSEVSQTLRNYHREEDAANPLTNQRELVFIMVDVDFFKHVNDDFGHSVGDELLRKFAERLSQVMRKSDVLIRWGGEEFLVLSRSASTSGAPVFCQRILEVIASEPFVLGKDIRIRKTCSIGWASYPWIGSDVEALSADEVIELADSALYLAKSSGRNQSIGFLPSESALAESRNLSMEALRDHRSGLIRLEKTPGPVSRIERLPGGFADPAAQSALHQDLK
jgi:diguanylate cyclase (GGDEF)-like protein